MPHLDAPVGEFDLVDHNGRAVSERDFQGRFSIILFGFTHCRIVCPRSLTKISLVLDMIGASGRAFQPYYVTVDPARDAPATMRAFLERWPRFVGLTGNTQQIEAAKSAFRVYARARTDPIAEDQIAHTAFTYLLDTEGRHIDHWGEHCDDAEVAKRLVRHLLTVSNWAGSKTVLCRPRPQASA